jgi:hypothetical protein
MHVILKTPRLAIRQFTENDVDNLFDLNSDPEVMRYLGRAAPWEVLRDEIIPFHLDVCKRLDRLGIWVAESADHGEFRGWFCFRPGPGGDIANIELGLPAAQVHLEQGLCHRGLTGPDQHGLRRPRRPARVRAHHDGQRRVPARDGKVRPDSRAHGPLRRGRTPTSSTAPSTARLSTR